MPKFEYEDVADEIREIQKPSLPFFIANWVFGIGIIECPLGKRQLIFSLFYTSVILLIYVTLAVHSFPMIDLMNRGFETIRMIKKLLFYSSVLLTIGTTILGWYRDKGVYWIFYHIAIANRLLQHIGIPRNYTRFFKSELRKIAGYFTFIIIIVIIDLAILLSSPFKQNGMILTFVTNYPIIIISIVDTSFIVIIKFIRIKLRELNSLLKSLQTSTYNFPQHKRVIRVSNLKSLTQRKQTVDNISPDIASTICTARKAHLELVKACRMADNTFGTHILLSIAIATGVITGSFYWVYVLLSCTKISHDVSWKILLNISIWVVYYFSKIYTICYCCNSTSNESVRTGDIIAELYDEPMVDEETKEEIKDYLMQLMESFIEFKARGFIKLDFTLIQGILASITTYLMVLIQLGKTQSNCTD